MIGTLNNYLYLTRLLGSIALFIVIISLIKLSTNIHFPLDMAISIDLLIVIPSMHWLLIRKSKIPTTTIIPVIITGMLIGLYFLPSENRQYILLFKTWGFPIIELLVVGGILLKVRKGIRLFKSNKSVNSDFYDHLFSTCTKLFPKRVATVLSTEIAVLYYSFFKWKKRTYQAHEFTGHLNSGSQAILLAIGFILVIELFVVHHLIQDWNLTLSWVLTGTSLYSILQVIAFAKSLSHRVIQVNQEKIILRYGFMKESVFDLNNIREVELSSKDLEKDDSTVKLSILGDLEPHNVIIHLHNKTIMRGIFGIEREYKSVCVFIDEPENFVELIKTSLEYSSSAEHA